MKVDAETSVTSASSKRWSLAMVEKGKDGGDYKGRERGWRREIFLRRLRRFKEREGSSMARRTVASEEDECGKIKKNHLRKMQDREKTLQMGDGEDDGEREREMEKTMGRERERDGEDNGQSGADGGCSEEAIWRCRRGGEAARW
ncbi:hypothetical protein ACLOJK_041227 [Asimina triloba]